MIERREKLVYFKRLISSLKINKIVPEAHIALDLREEEFLKMLNENPKITLNDINRYVKLKRNEIIDKYTVDKIKGLEMKENEVDITHIKSKDEIEKKLLQSEVILKYFKYNEKINDIAKSLNINIQTVKRWKNNFLKTGNAYSKRGRKIQETPIDIKKYILELFNNEPLITQKEIKRRIQKEFHINFGKNKISRIIRTLGSYSLPKTVPLLSNINQKKRSIYSNQMIRKNHNNIVFTDETLIDLNRNKRKIFKESKKQVYKYKSTGKAKLMVFGAISNKGQVYFEIIDETINSERYKETLQKLIVAANKKHPKGWILMQDNARAHTESSVLAYLDENQIRVLDHPPQSPDLNPIESVWALLKKKIEEKKIYSINKLRFEIEDIWNSIPLKTMQTYIKNFRKRLLIVKQSHGSNIPRVERKTKTNAQVNKLKDDTKYTSDNEDEDYKPSRQKKQKRDNKGWFIKEEDS